MDSYPSGDKSRSRKKSRIDYREILSEQDFAVFSRLRELRKILAEKEAVPVYAVCANEQLAKMSRERCSSLSQLQEINGFGEAKANKYGRAFLEAISEMKIDGVENEKSGKSD